MINAIHIDSQIAHFDAVEVLQNCKINTHFLFNTTD